MPARSRTGDLRLLAAGLVVSLLVGVLAAVEPAIAIGVVLGLAFAVVVFADLAAGFAVLCLLSFLDILPTTGGLSLSKGAGLLLALAWLARAATRA